MRCVGRSRRSRGSGFTLLELLVAIALMAVLAVLCWRGLDSVVRSRERITAASDELRALTAAFGQIEQDLSASWGVRLLGIQARDPIVFNRNAQSGSIELDLLCETGSPDPSKRLQRVVYRLRDGQLERGFASWTPPSADSLQTLQTPPVTWQPLLADVAVIEIRAYVQQQKAWVTADSLVGATALSAAANAVQNAVASSSDPNVSNAPTNMVGRSITGIEWVMARRGGGRIARVFAVKD